MDKAIASMLDAGGRVRIESRFGSDEILSYQEECHPLFAPCNNMKQMIFTTTGKIFPEEVRLCTLEVTVAVKEGGWLTVYTRGIG
jgi:hypothetical protein